MTKKLYEILGIKDETASQETLTKAFRRRALVIHPDKPGGDPEEFKRLNQAYELLSNPPQRMLYDQGLIDDDGKNILGKDFTYEDSESFAEEKVEKPSAMPYVQDFTEDQRNELTRLLNKLRSKPSLLKGKYEQGMDNNMLANIINGKLSLAGALKQKVWREVDPEIVTLLENMQKAYALSFKEKQFGTPLTLDQLVKINTLLQTLEKKDDLISTYIKPEKLFPSMSFFKRGPDKIGALKQLKELAKTMGISEAIKEVERNHPLAKEGKNSSTAALFEELLKGSKPSPGQG